MMLNLLYLNMHRFTSYPALFFISLHFLTQKCVADFLIFLVGVLRLCFYCDTTSECSLSKLCSTFSCYTCFSCFMLIALTNEFHVFIFFARNNITNIEGVQHDNGNNVQKSYNYPINLSTMEKIKNFIV